MRHIPNIITCLNLSAGFSAIVFTAGGDLVTASWLILTAMIFDFFDGFSARLLKAYSLIGKELDSLADMVSFGVAPGLIIFRLLDSSLTGSATDSFDHESLRTIIRYGIPVLMPVCTGLRLAKFNIDKNQVSSFTGLPSPANALAVIALIITAHYSRLSLADSLLYSPLFIILFSLTLSLLMVCKLPLFSLKFSDLSIKGNTDRYIFAATVLISFVFLGISAALLIIPIYISVSLISVFFRK
jgi:CDP-diacylglycerol---serine O-phosphatidyltransferase